MRAKSLLLVSIIALLILSGCVGQETKKTDTPTKTPAKNVTKNVTKDTTPPSSISNLQSEAGYNWINWTWNNPGDEDFSYANIYIDGKFKVNLTTPKNTTPKNYYNLTGLASSKQYTISVRTVDKSKNMNPEWVNSSALTRNKPPPFKDTTPPGQIENLKATVARTWINWTWENPGDADFSYTNIYVDGIFKTNLTKPKNYYNISGLAQNTTKTISIRTVDKNKTINLLRVTNTATTILDLTPPNSVTNLASVIGRTWINWTWDNPQDVDFSYAMVYMDSKFKTNTSKGYYNSTGLKNSTNYTISLLTVDTSKNINLGWVNSTEITLT